MNEEVKSREVEVLKRRTNNTQEDNYVESGLGTTVS